MTQQERVFLFGEGDRVQLISPIPGLAAGAVGTVVLQLLRAMICVVRFDEQTEVRLVDGTKLAPALPESARAS
jgi:hypothetical protein